MANHPSLLRPSCSKGRHQSQILRHFILMINALIWCNFEKNWLGSFWDNPIYPIGYPHRLKGPRIFLKGQKDAVFILIQLCYVVLWLFTHYKWAKIEEVVKSDTRLRTKVLHDFTWFFTLRLVSFCQLPQFYPTYGGKTAIAQYSKVG